MITWGCSIDGITDRIETPLTEIDKECGTAPLCVILPQNITGYSETGQAAQQSRICKGYSWPPEAMYNPDKGVRRLPINLAWQLMLASGDERISWRSQENIKIPLAKPVADHISHYLPNSVEHIVLAIPNELHEYWQDALIKALKRKGYKATLLWRPVASAIAWCDALPPTELKQIDDNDHLIVIHLGSDIFEVVPFRLKKESSQEKEYIVPIRLRPKASKIISGISLIASAAENLIQDLYEGDPDNNAVWQAFSFFPDLWETVINGKCKSTAVRVINNKGTWELWNPNGSVASSLSHATIRSQFLEDMVKKCSKVEFANAMVQEGSVVDIFTERITNVINDIKSSFEDSENEIVGAVITGNMAHLPCEEQYLKDRVIGILKDAGLGYDDIDHPASAYIYYPDGSDNQMIAKGCLTYQERLDNDLPTYYDTLPKLDIRVVINNKPTWSSLVKAEVVKGGSDYEHYLDSKFAVIQGKKDIEFYLRRDDADEFRKLPFSLPRECEEKIGLNMNVHMKPAQGFASVEVIPHIVKAFGTDHLYLDWSQMEPSPLPIIQKGIGYPETFSLATHHQVYAAVEYVFHKYLNTPITDSAYRRTLIKLRDEVKGTKSIQVGYRQFSARLVNEDGKLPDSVYTNVFESVLDRLDKDLKAMIRTWRGSPREKETVRYLRQTATWFFAAAPDSYISHVRQHLNKKRHRSEMDIIHAAGRSITTVMDMSLFFKIAIERIKWDRDGTNNWISSMSKILQHRNNAPESLTRENALFLAKYAYKRMQSQLYMNNIKQIFKNSAHLFLYLLRWRIVGDFLTTGSEYKLGQDVKEILEKAAELSQQTYIKNMLKEIAKYIEFQGTTLITGFPDE